MKFFILAAMATVAAPAAQAATIIPVSAIGSSNYNGYADYNAIDQGPGAAVSDWASNSQGVGSSLELDLGAVYRLTAAAVTDRVTSGGGNNGFVGGLYDFTTSYSLTAFTDSSFTTVIGSAVIVNKANPAVHSSPADFLSTAALGGVKAEFVKYTVLATNGVNPGLSDISFTGTAVPEPASWGMMIAGLALVGIASRRRTARLAA